MKYLKVGDGTAGTVASGTVKEVRENELNIILEDVVISGIPQSEDYIFHLSYKNRDILTKKGIADNLVNQRLILKLENYTSEGYNGNRYYNFGYVIQ